MAKQLLGNDPFAAHPAWQDNVVTKLAAAEAPALPPMASLSQPEVQEVRNEPRVDLAPTKALSSRRWLAMLSDLVFPLRPAAGARLPRAATVVVLLPQRAVLPDLLLVARTLTHLDGRQARVVAPECLAGTAAKLDAPWLLAPQAAARLAARGETVLVVREAAAEPFPLEMAAQPCAFVRAFIIDESGSEHSSHLTAWGRPLLLHLQELPS